MEALFLFIVAFSRLSEILLLWRIWHFPPCGLQPCGTGSLLSGGHLQAALQQKPVPCIVGLGCKFATLFSDDGGAVSACFYTNRTTVTSEDALLTRCTKEYVAANCIAQYDFV